MNEGAPADEAIWSIFEKSCYLYPAQRSRRSSLVRRARLPRDYGAMSDGEADNGEPADARDLFVWLSREVHELVSHVPRVQRAPTPIQFLREFVSANRPVVVKDAFNDWPAMERWSLDYLADAMGDTKVSVNVTPDGRGDALLSTRGWTVSGTGEETPDEVFVQPEERTMTMREFVDMLETPVGDDHGDVHPSHRPPVPYVSRQCGSLLEEFPKLVGDCVNEMRFASDAMGKAPDAVNLWIGDERSETTFHRDHYENVYCVVRGIKTFHLLPPCDGRLLGYREAPAAKFKSLTSSSQGGTFGVELEKPRRLVSWASATPASLRARACTVPEDPVVPIVVEVRAGECLFLPAMWYHHVTQARDESGTPAIAVNYWYDMNFDDRYAYARFTQEAHARFGGENTPR